MLLTTECVLADIKEEGGGTPPMGGGMPQWEVECQDDVIFLTKSMYYLMLSQHYHAKMSYFPLTHFTSSNVNLEIGFSEEDFSTLSKSIPLLFMLVFKMVNLCSSKSFKS